MYGCLVFVVVEWVDSFPGFAADCMLIDDRVEVEELEVLTRYSGSLRLVENLTLTAE